MGDRDDISDASGDELAKLEAAELAAERDIKARPYYATADETTDNYKNNHNFAALHLKEGERPTLSQLVDTCLKERTSEFVLFEQGMWVEYRSNDMKWKVGRVNRVIKQPPDNWDFDVEQTDPPEKDLEISYNIGVEGVVYEDNIRAPALGLQAVFGMRPWLWQQFTLLQLEKRIRFDRYHEYDFEEIDNLKFATSRYELWLNAGQNLDFRELHDSQREIAQKLLRSHLMVPFDLMDFIVERKDEWNFNDPDINVYTYAGVLGSGYLTTIIILMIQIFTPLVLLYNNMLQSDGAFSNRFEINDIGGGLPANGNFIPKTDFDTFCNGLDSDEVGRLEGKILIVMVLFIYAASVVPDSLLGFYRTSGGYKSTYSKINSLRNIVWEQNDDDFFQEVGFKLDRFMNTGYISILYVIMLFVLLNTPIVLDLILNALAVDFIHMIDERIADADWWDEDNRWIKAGTIELVIQSTLRLRVLDSANRICEEYGIKKKTYKKALNGMKALHSKRVAKRDDAQEAYMTDREIVFAGVAKEAEEAEDEFVLNEYEKDLVQFGIVDYLREKIFGRTKGVFNRYIDYRVWDRWERVMFLPIVPAGDEHLRGSTKRQNVILGKTDPQEFVTHVLRVLSMKELGGSLKKAWTHGNYSQIPRKVILGLVEILLYILQLLFPLIIIGCFIFVPICY